MAANDDMDNCKKTSQAIAANPFEYSDDGHISGCASCQALLRDLRAFDKRIQRALALPVPDIQIPALPDVDTSNVTTLPGRRLGMPAWLAMAATIAVAAFVGIRMLSNDISSQSLADQIMAHVDHEPYALRVTDKAVSASRLERVVQANVSTFGHSDGLITYAQSCIINGKEVPHLVLQGKLGPITILLMPHEKVSGTQSIAGESVNGVIVPVGDGSIAIIGEDGESLQQVEDKVKSSVTWGA